MESLNSRSSDLDWNAETRSLGERWQIDSRIIAPKPATTSSRAKNSVYVTDATLSGEQVIARRSPNRARSESSSGVSGC
jgi:hypothetical protein